MLNEFEIVVFGCLLDHCPWNIDDVLALEDGSNLWEFPSNFGLDISIDCKRFIIYLLIITFALKVKNFPSKRLNVIAIPWR